MAHSYPEPTQVRYGVLLMGVTIALAAFALGWLGHVWLSSGEPENGSTGSVATQSPSPTDNSTGAGPADDRLIQCQAVFAAQDQPLEAGAAALSQWVVHIDAMNKLVAGRITLDQATKFWDQTRHGAHARLDAYADAVSRFDARTARCEVADANQEAALQTCSAAVAARGHQLDLVDRALGTWRTHVSHMEMLRRGEMTAQRATKLWMKNWRQGQAEVEVYRTAARDAQSLHC